MGVGNHTYRNVRTGAIVTAARITRMNMKSAHGAPGARSTGDEKIESYAVSTADGDVKANPGDWAINDGSGNYSVMAHGEFAAAYRPAPPDPPEAA